MLIDHVVQAMQVITFGFIASGCVLCVWAVALDARESDVEHSRDPEDAGRRSSQSEALAAAIAREQTRNIKSRPFLPLNAA
jgi:hypothetical protein